MGKGKNVLHVDWILGILIAENKQGVQKIFKELRVEGQVDIYRYGDKLQKRHQEIFSR